MILELNYLNDIDALFVKMSGEHPSGDKLKNTYEKIKDYSTKYQTSKYLVNYTEMDYQLDISNAHNSVELLENYGLLNENTIVAFIFEKGSESLDNFQHFLSQIDLEKFFHRAAGEIRVFFDYDEAYNWIKDK